MLESVPVILVISTLLGFLAGIGVGGGSLLILWLTLVVGMEQPLARILNLLFFLPSAGVATLFRWRQGKLNLKVVFPAVITGCIAAGLFSYINTWVDVAVLKKLFGFLLLATGFREVLYQPKNH